MEMKRVWNSTSGAWLYKWVSGVGGGVHWRAEYPPPRAEMSSAEWMHTCAPGRFSLFKARLVEVDPPYCAGFAPQAFLFPHPALMEHCWPCGKVEIDGTRVLEIPYGRTVGARGTVLTADNVLINDLCNYPKDPANPAHFLMKPPQAQPSGLRRRRGVYALLNTYGTSTYHWIYDTLPRLGVLRRAGYDIDAFDGFFLRRPKYEPHYATLALLGIPEEKIVWCTRNSHFGCDRLVVPSLTTDDEAFDQKHHHPWVYPFLRAMARGGSGRRRRLFINRRDSRAHTRQVANQAELAALLARYHFEEVTLGELDFATQARLFAEAEFIVSPHGGGLSNLCFCAPSTRLLELFAPDYVRAHFRNIARQIGVSYQPLVMEALEGSAATSLGGDIRADLAKVETLVQRMLEEG